jgi:hypothetical protein
MIWPNESTAHSLQFLWPPEETIPKVGSLRKRNARPLRARQSGRLIRPD